MRGKRTVEINPNHPIIQTLKEAYEADKDSEETKNTAILLYNTALINSGFPSQFPLTDAWRQAQPTGGVAQPHRGVPAASRARGRPGRAV